METIPIKVHDLCGEYCISDAESRVLADAIVANLQKKQVVALDFDGVDTVLTAFLNSLFSHLIGHYSYDQISAGITLNGFTSDNIKQKFHHSLAGVKSYLEKPEELQRIIRERVNRAFNSIDLDAE